jgi:putative ABC transport system permease protein
MFWRFVVGAVKLRRRRLALAFSAMAVAGALATSLFTVYSDVENRLSRQFQAYGANVVVSPAGGALTVPLHAVDEVRRMGGTAAPFLYSLDQLAGKPVVIAGVDLAVSSKLIQYWHVEGARGDCLAGDSLGLKIGETARLQKYSCVVTGVVSTGGAEDAQMILPFDTVARLAGVTDGASLIQARIPTERVGELAKALPGADVRLIRAVAETEANVVLKVRVALFLLLGVILGIVTLSLTSNFGELVMERSKEIGILKAIGAGDEKIAGLFLAEALMLAVLAALAGYILGIFLAGWIDQSVFETAFAIHLNLAVLALSAGVTFVVALTATGLATGRIWKIQPASILRGE